MRPTCFTKHGWANPHIFQVWPYAGWNPLQVVSSLEKNGSNIGKNGPLALIFEIFSNRAVSEIIREIPLFRVLQRRFPANFFYKSHNRFKGPYSGVFKPYSDVFGPYSGVFLQNFFTSPITGSRGPIVAFLSPIVTFLGPIAAFSCKIFLQVP